MPTPELHFGFRLPTASSPPPPTLNSTSSLSPPGPIASGDRHRSDTQGHRTIAAITSAPENVRNSSRSAPPINVSPIHARFRPKTPAAWRPLTRPYWRSAAASTLPKYLPRSPHQRSIGLVTRNSAPLGHGHRVPAYRSRRREHLRAHHPHRHRARGVFIPDPSPGGTWRLRDIASTT